MSHGSGSVRRACMSRKRRSTSLPSPAASIRTRSTADWRASRRHAVRGADDGEADGRMRRGGRHVEPEDDCVRRRPDVRDRVQARDGPLRLQARTDLWAGRGADDDNGPEQGAAWERGAPALRGSGWRWRATPSRAGVEVRIADSEDRPLPAGEVGGILVRGDVVMRGYWHNDTASAETLRGGWLHTGDVGALDGEGFLSLKDRSKDVIIQGGENIYPREVEEVLLGHPLVSEVAVVGEPGFPGGAKTSWRSSSPSPARKSPGVSSMLSARAHRPLQAVRSAISSWTRCRRT